MSNKGEEGQNYIRLLVLENPNSLFINDLLMLILPFCLASLGRELHLDRNSETFPAIASFLSLASDLFPLFLGNLSKRIALNLKDTIIRTKHQSLLVSNKLFLSASTNLLSRDANDLDDADEKMTRDEIEYMLTNSEEDADEIEMLQESFFRQLMAREVMVPLNILWIFRFISSNDCLYIKFLTYPL